MGWTSYNADITTRGKVDRNKIKAICDEQLTWTNDSGSRKPIKSAMVGNTYYAAVEHIQPDGSRRVWAAITLVKTNIKDYWNFAYKDMDETVGPCECKCPVGILNLLTETGHEWAKEWRESCWKYHAKQKEKRSKPSLGKLPVGTVIEFTLEDSYSVTGTFRAKKILYYKYKRPVWAGSGWRFPTKVIPDNWKVVESV